MAGAAMTQLSVNTSLQYSFPMARWNRCDGSTISSEFPAPLKNAVRFQEEFGKVDVSMNLPRVKAPTLVIHCRGDLSVPFEEGRLIASSVPNSRLVTLESRNHLLLENDPAWHNFVSEVRNFLGKQEVIPSVSNKARKKTGLGISAWIKGPKT